MQLDLVLPAFRQHWRAAGYSQTTAYQYEWTWRSLQAKGIPLPPDLDLDTARSYVAKRLADGEVKPSTVVFEVKAIRCLAKFVAEFLDEPNKLAALKIPRADEPGPQPTADADDLARLLASCAQLKGFEGVRDRALILFFSVTGARRSEVCRMKTSDLDLDAGTASLRTTKARVPRVVDVSPIIAELTRYLAWRERHHGRADAHLWLSQTGKGLTDQGMGYVLKRRRIAAGLPKGLSTHAFRRGLAIQWLERGGSEVGLMAVCGWQSTEMVARYTRTRSAELGLAEQRRLFGTPEPARRGRPRAATS